MPRASCRSPFGIKPPPNPPTAWLQGLIPTLSGIMVLPEDFEKLLVADFLGVKDHPHHLGVPGQPCSQSQLRRSPSTLPHNLPLPRNGRAGERDRDMEGMQHCPESLGPPSPGA